MSRPYRFVRLDEARQPSGEFTLLCPSDDDARLVGGQLGQAVQIWEGARHVGGVEAAEPAPDAEPVPEPISEPEMTLAAPTAAPAPAVLAPPPEPAPEPRQPTRPDDVPRAYNPFRPAAWVRKRP